METTDDDGWAQVQAVELENDRLRKTLAEARVAHSFTMTMLITAREELTRLRTAVLSADECRVCKRCWPAGQPSHHPSCVFAAGEPEGA